MAGKFGRTPPEHSALALPFAPYVRQGTWAVPSAFSILPRVFKAVKVANSPAGEGALFPMDGNDLYGDCTVAALAHNQTIWRAMGGALSVVPALAVERVYFTLSGGEDTGLPCTRVLDYAHRHALAGDKVLAYVRVDPKNAAHVQQALALFGSLYIGFNCTTATIAQFDAHEPWSTGVLSGEGHCVVVTGYDSAIYEMLTWGARQYGTHEWWDQCVDEAYATLPSEAIFDTKGFLPGYNIAQLVKDLHAIEG